MICRTCQAQNSDHRRYCGQCGGAIARPCPRCSFFNSLSDLFCGGCGQKFSELRANHALGEVQRAVSEKNDGIRQLSPLEMRDLLVTSASKAAQPLQGEVSQNELDKLFGDEP